mmetsp:Transcript_16952/g.30464  ORF Transcript_16952/g.30464 Transcript_16952/m.30464 type:complete len:239 (+) Transcript_16952:3381-4097(+)|eukprot:CAMPEP_0204910996 /NCGR_PEP_ID=MMETSP1397-20131031/9423_1 /ASSEMBLY_ACC=CAM_ASM_000891 /TAXON_ID=49980 /ORGANISM="Climacostomum Climacostomum virens, Strain Stock W-24" /LENGTH=238 /DNA_ID=CAMNT_0052081379 /DNA_START=29 /DNA_END=742 /DNA_ORIENTATION=-
MADYSWRSVSVVVLCSVILVTLASVPAGHEVVAEIFTDIHGMGELGRVVFLLLYVEAMLIGFPITVLDIALVFLYPWQEAYLMAWFGCLMAASVVYLNSRFLFRASTDQLMKENQTLAAVHKVLERNPWKYIILLRLIYLPGFIMNYGLPAIGVHYIPYIASEMIVRTPSIAWHILLGINGKSLRDSIAIWQFSDKSLTILLVIIGLSALGLFGLWKLTRAVMQEVNAMIVESPLEAK